MACWIKIEKKDEEVRFEDGQLFEVGPRVSMGLGSIELRQTKKAGLHVVRFSGSGHFKYSLKLVRDGSYRLGPDRGHRVVQASEERDPIKRVLREMEIPVSCLHRMSGGEALPVVTFLCDIGRAYREGTTNNFYRTDGAVETKVTSCKDMTHVNQYCGPEVHESGEIAGATYAIEVVQRVHMNSTIGTYVGKIVVWPNCDPTTLANALAPIVFGEGANFAYPAAVSNADVAARWIREHFSIEPDEDGGFVKVNGEKFPIISLCRRKPVVLHRLVQLHGLALLEPYYGVEQREFVGSHETARSAAEYILKRYDVVAVARGDERMLKFGVKGSGKLADTNSVYINGHEDKTLKTLMEEHGQPLKDLLYALASRRSELVDTYPYCRGFKLQDGMWWVHCDWEGEYKSDDFRPIAREEDAVPVRLGEGEFSKQLLGLSSLERRQSARSMGGFHAVMRDGDEAYIDAYSALLPIRVGETKNFVFRISHRWASSGAGASIWGISVRRDEEGVEYAPYDNGVLYTCEGYWGGEVSTAPLES